MDQAIKKELKEKIYTNMDNFGLKHMIISSYIRQIDSKT